MITIIHGDDVANSRKYYLSEREKVANPVIFAAEKVTLSDLMQVFEGGRLFSDNKKVFIENFFSKKKASKEYDEIIDYLKQIQENGEIFFWEEKEITAKKISVFKKLISKVFKFPQNLFLFLDSIKPGNGKTLISLFHKTIETAEPEMIFFMLIRQLRIILALSDKSSSSQIDELKRLAPWQKSKLQKQASFFSQKQLIDLYKKLFEIDLAIKTGKSSLNLIQAIDFFLLSI
ncbi:MAG: hypothetical protein HYT83_04105 [Candidatus Levybacteria bacterium]|nr:hypothetical protein [Candidatus Levybacteria bacterium]